MELVNSNHPALIKKSAPLEKGTDVREIVDEMYMIMKQRFGIGLAAPQVGINKRLFITHLEGDKIFINPKIIKKWGSIKKEEEACISLPNVFVSVPRHEKVYVEYYDENWVHHKEIFSGLLSRVIQHEQDHLNGKLIIDYK